MMVIGIHKDKRYLIYVFFVYLFCFQEFLQQHIPVFQYVDELFAVSFFIFVFFYVARNAKCVQYQLWLLLLLAVIICLGILPHLLYRYQSTGAVLSDMVVLSKFFLSLLAAQILFKGLDIRAISTRLAVHLRGITIFLAGLSVVAFVQSLLSLRLLPLTAFPLQLFYSHCTYLAATCGFLLVNFTLIKPSGKNKICIYLNCLMMALTFRSKALVAALAFLFLWHWVFREKEKLNLKFLGILGPCAVIFALPKLYKYFYVYTNSARAVLTKYSFIVAMDHFPLGSGFATFGSYFSGVQYSPIYQIYHLTEVDGLNPRRPSYISDTFWPMILGQFGFFGFLVYVLLILILLSCIQKLYRQDKNLYCSGLYALIYLLIVSFGESAFVNSYAVMFGMTLGYILSSGYERIKSNGQLSNDYSSCL